MGIRTTTLIPVVGAGAFVAGLLLGLWAGGREPSSLGSPRNAGSESARTGPGDAEGAAGGGSGASGGGEGRDSGPSTGASGGAATSPSSAPASGSATTSSPSTAAAGAVPRGTSTGRPASTSVTTGGPEEETRPPAEDGEDMVVTEEAESGPPRSLPTRSGALPPYALPEKVTGRISDALTGAVPPGATVRLQWQLSDGTVSSSVGAEVHEDGTFVLFPQEAMRAQMENAVREGGWLRDRFRNPEEALADLEYALEGTAKGYRTLRKGDPAASTDLPLVPEGLDRMPGAVRVDARRGDGSRFPGRMLVDFLSGDRGFFSQWAFPEPDGSFLMVGVPAGRWSVRAAGKSDSGKEITVPESGEVRVEVLVPRIGLAEAVGAPAGEPREVRVGLGGRGLPAGSFLRAEARPGLFFRVEVLGGSATFAALPAGKWTLVLQVPGGAEESLPVEVPEGAGTFEVEFPPEGR